MSQHEQYTAMIKAATSSTISVFGAAFAWLEHVATALGAIAAIVSIVAGIYAIRVAHDTLRRRKEKQ